MTFEEKPHKQLWTICYTKKRLSNTPLLVSLLHTLPN